MKYGTVLGVGLVLFIVMLFASTAFACSINVDNARTELRSETDGYATSISAEDNSQIDIKNSFTISDVTGSDCPTNITVKNQVFREISGNWVLYRTTATKTQELAEDDYVFVWSNDFSVDNQYERYKVEGIVLQGSTEIERTESYIDIQNNSCSGIVLTTYDITLGEDTTATRTFRIENNTNTAFDISNLSILFTNALISSGSADYDTTINRYSNGNVYVSLDAGYVSSNTTTTGTFSVAGYLGSQYCSETNIGRKTFSVTVQETGNNSGSNYTTSSDCDDLSIQSKDITLNEGTEAKSVFYLENNSTKRFELTDVSITNNGLDLAAYYYEQYAFPSEIADIVISAKAPNVIQDKSYSNTIQIKGRFSDGKTCSFSSINEENFNVNIKDTTSSIFFAGCEAFTINAPASVSIENFGSIPITIVNGTNKTANIYIEGDLSVSPTMISLPANSSISRDLTVSINKNSGEIDLRPAIDSCNTQTKRIIVTNTAQGNLSLIAISPSIIQTDGGMVLSVEFNNPTTKIFTGTISTNLRNYVADDKIITIPSGKSYTEINLTNANNTNGNDTLSFSSEGETKTVALYSGEGSLSGLFLFFGANAFGIGLLIIIIIIVVAIIVVAGAYPGNDRPKEPWENTKY